MAAAVAIAFFVMSNTEDDRSSPLSAYLGFDRPDLDFAADAETEAAMGQAAEQHETLVAACMADSGYEYEPADAEQTWTGPDPGSRRYAETYGFGITTMAYSQTQVGDHLTGYPEPAEPAPDPNLDHLEQLPSDQRVGYLRTLTGATIDPDQPITADLLRHTTGDRGCHGQATDRSAELTAFYDTFGDDIDQLRREVFTDPAVVEHDRHIEDCVTGTGIDYTPTWDLYQRWAPALQQIHDQTVDDSADHSATEGADDGALPQLTAQARAELLTIQNEETELAVAVHDCGGTPTKTAAVLTEAAHRHEQAFITNNQARLDAFRTRATS
jgi:hypothetical protein